MRFGEGLNRRPRRTCDQAETKCDKTGGSTQSSDTMRGTRTAPDGESQISSQKQSPEFGLGRSARSEMSSFPGFRFCLANQLTTLPIIPYDRSAASNGGSRTAILRGPGGQIAQLVEHGPEKAGVGGSSPPLTISSSPSADGNFRS